MKKIICAISAIVISAAVFSSCGNDEGILLEHNDDAVHIVETEPVSTRPKVKVVEKTTASADETDEKTETTAKADDKKDESSQTATKYLEQGAGDAAPPDNNESVSDESEQTAENEEAPTEGECEEYFLEGVVYRKYDKSVLIKEVDMSLMTVGISDAGLMKSLETGDKIQIVYDGYILESYPAQVSKVYSVEIMEKALCKTSVEHFVCDNPAVSSSFTVLLPEGWTVEEIEYPTEGDFTDWGFRIIPEGETTGLDITWHSSFSIREPYDVFPVTVNGYDVKKYGANGKWRFYGYDNGYVASNNFYNTSKYDEYADEFEFILNTLVFGQHEFIGE
ncbi:MAG: hypothetical protein IKV85_11365 [Ruminococcus sp.]|nr:hypothetical protein [Ruminococcus sp.]